MKKLLILLLALNLNLGVTAAFADENLEDADKIVEASESESVVKSEELALSQTDENQNNEEQVTNDSLQDVSSLPTKEPEYEEIKHIKTTLVTLPDCENETLLQKTEAYIKSYFDATPNQGTIYRRRRYFILKNLDKFKEENVANYKTAAQRPVSDIIATTKINEKVAEENMRLCKNLSKDEYAGKIYLLIYPKDNAYKVQLINLAIKPIPGRETAFTYEK